MRILILANYDVGLYQFRRELIQSLSENNEVVIALPYGKLVNPLVDLGCKFIDTSVDRRGMNPVKDVKLMFSYLKIIKREKPDLVVTYTIKPNVYGGLACRIMKLPYAINITGLGSAFEKEGVLKRIVVFLNRLACKNSKVVFFENKSNMSYFLDEKIIDKDRAHLLCGAGVNLDKYQVKKYPKGEKTKFLFMGRVMKEKGIDELITAMRRLCQTGEDCELDILGGLEENYRDLINECEAEGWLHYHGYQENVLPFIEDSHCFVLPSWHEGMSNANLECAASGRPIITTAIPGCMEAVIDGESGFLVNKKDADDLYRTMKKFINLPFENKRDMGLSGRNHMEKNFDKRKVVAETISCIMDGQIW